MSANMVLDGILTVVDSKHIIGQLQEEHTALTPQPKRFSARHRTSQKGR